jgi:hypothetical protein
MRRQRRFKLKLVNKDAPVLTNLEKQEFGAELELESVNEAVLQKWRLGIEEGVSKENKYEEYSRMVFSPWCIGMSSNTMKITLKLITFEQVNVFKLQG